MPSTIKTFFGLIKFEHTVFALPFAYIGMMGNQPEFELESSEPGPWKLDGKAMDPMVFK